MNNGAAEKILDDCMADLSEVDKIIRDLRATSNAVPYLTRFAVIRACGAIELALKTIVADYCDRESKQQVRNYFSNRVRETALIPSYDNICKFLKLFDENWNDTFKNLIGERPNASNLRESLLALVTARNLFAHGGNPISSIGDILRYFKEAREIIEVVDSVVTDP